MEGFEPPTSCSQGRRTAKLSYTQVMPVNRMNVNPAPLTFCRAASSFSLHVAPHQGFTCSRARVRLFTNASLKVASGFCLSFQAATDHARPTALLHVLIGQMKVILLPHHLRTHAPKPCQSGYRQPKPVTCQAPFIPAYLASCLTFRIGCNYFNMVRS